MVTQTKYNVLAIIFFSLISCKQQRRGETNINNPKMDDDFQPTYTVTQLNDKLEFDFKQGHSDSFGQIFVDWNNNVKSNSEEFIHQNDTINAVFDVYKAFYQPLDLLKLGGWEWGNKLNSNCKYVVIQNKIFYSVLLSEDVDDFDWQKSRRDSIENFRPPINLDKDKVLYLTNEYAESINKFLGKESTKLGEGNIMNPSQPKEESEKRYKLLRSFIPILHGHWGGYWHLETHPDIGIIIFNKTLTKAKIDFRVGYQGGEATLEKKGNDWIIKESKATWIE